MPDVSVGTIEEKLLPGWPYSQAAGHMILMAHCISGVCPAWEDRGQACDILFPHLRQGKQLHAHAAAHYFLSF